MNWMRTILDGIAMAAYFNLFAAAVYVYLLSAPADVSQLSARHHQGGEQAAYQRGKPFLLALDLLWRAAASPSLWCGQRCGGRDNRILASIPDGIHPVDDDQHRRSSFSGCVADPEKKPPFYHLRNRRAPGYGFKAWMKEYALPEHLLQWPLLLCPSWRRPRRDCVCCCKKFDNKEMVQMKQNQVQQKKSAWDAWGTLRSWMSNPVFYVIGGLLPCRWCWQCCPLRCSISRRWVCSCCRSGAAGAALLVCLDTAAVCLWGRRHDGSDPPGCPLPSGF